MDGGDGNARSLGQVSLGKVHYQPMILEPQSEHLQDLGIRILLQVHIASVFSDANVINYSLNSNNAVNHYLIIAYGCRPR
jgi:hypothetical protein